MLGPGRPPPVTASALSYSGVQTGCTRRRPASSARPQRKRSLDQARDDESDQAQDAKLDDDRDDKPDQAQDDKSDQAQDDKPD